MNTLVRTLNFHGIGTPDPGIDAGESRYWISADFFQAVVEDLARPRPEHPIRITFDDGNQSDLEIAAPLLVRHNLSARFFVLTGRLAQSGYLGKDDLSEMRKMGFEIGSHGRDHVSWPNLSAVELDRETRQSRDILETLLNEPVTEAAIPFGDYNKRVLNALRSAGYTAAWTSDGGAMNPGDFLRPRLSIRNDMTLDTVRRALFDPINPVRQLRRSLAMARKRYF